LGQPSEDRLARNASRARFARRRQPLVALLAVGFLQRLAFVDLDGAGGPQFFQAASNTVEPIGLGVRISGQVDPVVIDVRLQEARADGALSTKLLHVGHGDVAFDARRRVAVGALRLLSDRRHVGMSGDDPMPSRPP
jgi:hypothetical protein